MDSFEYDPYYRWWYSVEKAGVPMETIKKYYSKYDEDSLFSVTFDGTTYTYSLLSRDAWQWSQNSEASTFIFNDSVTKTDYEWYYITSSISRMAYAADEVSVDTVDEIEDYVWNGDLYTVNSFDAENNEFELVLSDFYSVLSSSEPYIAEVNSILYRNNISQATNEETVAKSLCESEFPIRDENAQSLEQIVSMSSETQFTIGGTHPIILRTENGYECLVSKRSTEVNSWPEYWTLVPAGYFSPDGIDKRLGILNQFYSEYCEELFGEEEGSVTSDTKKIREAETNQKQGVAEYVVTGVGVDAVSLSFEVSGVYIVHDVKKAQQMKQDMDFNYEVTGAKFLDLDDTEQVEDFLTPEDVTPPSAFAFVNALQYLKERLPEEEQPESVKLIE